MALFKCKMCGGDLEVTPGITVAECEYCGTQQTLPKVNEEVVQNLFNRANALRLKCEFDKAEQIYEKILQENDAESEAHWGIVLCKYGIEYVEDPKTYKRIPTCHRTSYDAVTADADYLAAIEHADSVQRSIYEAEAKAIDEIQKNILSIVKDEKPFDVFICYKETDESGKRTVDSTIANDIYYQLTQEGLKVFYAAITLEDKLGREYEPYIFAALNSAKVMLVIGTKPQYFTAVWVKNEWSRFLKLMKSDRSKLLIPCYKDMDAYELPEEFVHLQAQDMGKIGFINDVVRGIKKVAVKEEPKATVIQETVVAAANSGTAILLKRAFMALEDGEWNRADDFCEQVLNIDPECAEAYLGKMMAELQVRTQEDLKNLAKPFDGVANYQKVLRFANEELKNTIVGYIAHIITRNEEAHLQSEYSRAKDYMSRASLGNSYIGAARLFEKLGEYRDSAELAKKCYECAEKARKKTIIIATIAAILCLCVAAAILYVTVIVPENKRNVKYNDAIAMMEAGKYEEAKAAFEAMEDYKDSKDFYKKTLYAYVQAHKNDVSKQRIFYEYLEELKNDNYLDSAAIYKEHTGQYTMLQFANITAANTKTVLEFIPKSAEYVHFGFVYYMRNPYSENIGIRVELLAGSKKLNTMNLENPVNNGVYSLEYIGPLQKLKTDHLTFNIYSGSDCIGTYEIALK